MLIEVNRRNRKRIKVYFLEKNVISEVSRCEIQKNKKQDRRVNESVIILQNSWEQPCKRERIDEWKDYTDESPEFTVQQQK